MKYRVFRVAAAFVLTAAFLLPQPSIAADDAAALLAKHRDYVGWHVGDGVVKTLRETGGLQYGEKFANRTTTLRYGVAHRTTTVDGRGLSEDDGFTGQVFWTSNENGFTVRPVGDVAKQLIDEDAIFGELIGMYAPTFVRHETVDGTDAVLLHLTHPVAYPVDVDVDPSTGAFLRVIIDPGIFCSIPVRASRR